MGEREIIFLGGVHGVGKSTYCKNILTKLGYSFVSASALIKSFDPKLLSATKYVEDIDRNQQILIEAIKAYSLKHHSFVIDGHYSLIDSSGLITPISENVFKALKVNKLVVLEADPQLIAERLTNRDNQNWSSSKIKEFQIFEIAQAKKISQRLGLQLELVEM